MCRQDLVLGQDTIDGRAKRRVLVLQCDAPVDMVDVEVRADALADIPALDFLANRDDLARHV